MTNPLSEAGTSVEAAPFAIGDLVETIKGAKFWGEVVSCYQVQKHANQPLEFDWRADVRAVAPDFLGTIHVYPTAQLTRRALIQPTPAETEGEWVLVPREPTHEMLVHRFEYTNELSRTDVWSAMLAASPTPPPIGDGEGDLGELVKRLRFEVDGREKYPYDFDQDLTADMRAACDAIESLSRQLEEMKIELDDCRTAFHAASDSYSRLRWPDTTGQ